MSGENLDLTSDATEKPSNGSQTANSRRFMGVHFTCCDIYTRVYVNREQTAYDGNCPKCARRVRLQIGPGGTDSRFFTAR